VETSKRRAKPELRGYLDLIELTDEQRAEVEGIRRRFLPKVGILRARLRQLRAELADRLFATPLDRRKAKATVVKISRLQLELELEVMEHILQERQLLTGSQRKRFRQIIAEQFSDGGLGIHDVRSGT